MQLRRVLAAVPLASLLLLIGCSKTEDVAPERQIFGDPPKIMNFRILNPDGSPATSPQLTPATVSCDFTEVVELRTCKLAAPLLCSDGSGPCDPFLKSRFDECHEPPTGAICETVDITDLKAISPIIMSGTYTEVRFEAVVDDPNTLRDEQGRITESNILLVASSFVLPSTNVETTLVLFDDGSTNKFPQRGRVQGEGLDCRIPAEDPGVCACEGDMYLVDSNDLTKDDLAYTRGFAFVNNSTSAWLQTCIMREKRQVPLPASPGSRMTFRIDAVDRQGNLQTWDKNAEIIVGVDTFTCTGDPCGCCYAISSDPTSECADKPGMISNFTPNGLCVDLF